MILPSLLLFLGVLSRCGWSRMESVDLISVGVPHTFELLEDDGRFGVFRKVYKDDSGRISYIIARTPLLKAHEEPPSSVLAEFDTEAEALRVFARTPGNVLAATASTISERCLILPQNRHQAGQGMTKDITAKVSKMPRNSAILYRHINSKRNPDPPAYLGLIRLKDGQIFWAVIWGRIVSGKRAVELQLKKKIE
jgi:hypothetical protein